LKKQSPPEYYCDVTKSKLVLGPDCELFFNFGYGSKYDGFRIKWHMGTKDAEKIFEMLIKKYPSLKTQFKKYYYKGSITPTLKG